MLLKLEQKGGYINFSSNYFYDLDITNIVNVLVIIDEIRYNENRNKIEIVVVCMIKE